MIINWPTPGYQYTTILAAHDQDTGFDQTAQGEAPAAAPFGPGLRKVAMDLRRRQLLGVRW